MKRSFLFLCLILGFVFTACSSPQVSQPPQASISVSSSVQRVVALTSLSVDIINRLSPDKLVGIAGSSLYKDDSRLKELPKVSEGRTAPNLEKILALKPDLVIGAEKFHEATASKLKELGVNCQLFEVKDWQSLEKMTTTIAQAIQADATPLLQKYQALREKPPANAPKSLVLVSRQPILSPNKNSWAGALLKSFNIPNLAADLQGASPIQGYVSLSPESVLKANPEAIALVETPMPNSNILKEFANEPFWQNLKAVKDKQIYVFDYYGLVNPGSIDSIETATQKLRQLANKQAS